MKTKLLIPLLTFLLLSLSKSAATAVNDKLDISNMQGVTTRVSVSSDGTQANDGSFYSFISADGRYVAFNSSATNLVAEDENDASNFFIHDRYTRETTSIGMASDRFSMSSNGRYIAFTSYASNLVPDDTNEESDIFVLDQDIGQTRRVSVATGGEQGNGSSWSPSISADGRYVAFTSAASNLVLNDTNGERDIFVYDQETNQTNRISVATGGEQGNGSSWFSTISANGRYVAFDSFANNLVSNDTNGLTLYLMS